MLKPISRTQWCLSLGALLLTHCSDGGNATSPQGSAGSAPTAGATSTAGTAAAQAGQAGAVATAGSPATAGSSTGGAGGSSAGTATGGSAGSGGAATGGSGGSGGSGAAGGVAGSGVGGGGAFKLTSSEHVEGAVFADALTCAGVGRSPALAWTAGPAGTKSYAITFLDETLVAKNNANGYHWVIWDIPAATLALPQNLPAGATLTSPVTAKQFSPANGFDNLPANAYFGPCPNAIGNTTNTDTYAFTIYALSVEQLTGNLNGVKNIEAAIKATTPLATTALHGTSMAKPN
ncbi:MAG TPA: YbhB/YbcL family Raf kinase inhibitor-like protein [Polyangiaceae bacterium]|nr:YbhB/YbcL family Raf kinase inhibitor-like protein [Polyangiaceae bacterium]